jgi:hypothetical protein
MTSAVSNAAGSRRKAYAAAGTVLFAATIIYYALHSDSSVPLTVIPPPPPPTTAADYSASLTFSPPPLPAASDTAGVSPSTITPTPLPPSIPDEGPLSSQLGFPVTDADARLLAAAVPLPMPVTHHAGSFLELKEMLNYSSIVIEMRRRQELGVELELSAPAPHNIKCSTYVPLPRAFNLLNQTGSYQHLAVYSCVTSKAFPFRKDALLDIAGLYVPVEYDCRNLVPGGAIWGTYDFFTPIPDRWTRCLDHQYLMVKGVKEGHPVVPLLPVIDEEYPERAALLQMVMLADATKQEEFVVVDIGARWGTWGARAVVSALWTWSCCACAFVVVSLSVTPSAFSAGCLA